MRFQDSQANCGPAAVANALEVLGVVGVDQSRVADLISKTTTNKKPSQAGTTQDELAQALNKWARVTFNGILFSAYEASYMLRGALAWGCVGIIGVDNTPTSGHWVAVVGSVGDRFLVVDGAQVELIIPTTEHDLLARWTSYERRGKKRAFYELLIAERGV